MTIDKIILPMYLVTHEDDSGLLAESTKLVLPVLLKKPVSAEHVVMAATRAL